MGRSRMRSQPLGTMWEILDALWRRIEPIFKEFWPRKATGRPPAHWRRTLNGILFRMHSVGLSHQEIVGATQDMHGILPENLTLLCI